jgi:hypothetical protein
MTATHSINCTNSSVPVLYLALYLGARRKQGRVRIRVRGRVLMADTAPWQPTCPCQVQREMHSAGRSP